MAFVARTRYRGADGVTFMGVRGQAAEPRLREGWLRWQRRTWSVGAQGGTEP